MDHGEKNVELIEDGEHENAVNLLHKEQVIF